uniref:Uncharacterized protein n=1 Tax=Oryza rufipogon TaxID=4529 RepID=A0A0E0NNR6_ORYRU
MDGGAERSVLIIRGRLLGSRAGLGSLRGHASLKSLENVMAELVLHALLHATLLGAYRMIPREVEWIMTVLNFDFSLLLDLCKKAQPMQPCEVL